MVASPAYDTIQRPSLTLFPFSFNAQQLVERLHGVLRPFLLRRLKVSVRLQGGSKRRPVGLLVSLRWALPAVSLAPLTGPPGALSDGTYGALTAIACVAGAVRDVGRKGLIQLQANRSSRQGVERQGMARQGRRAASRWL